MVLTKNINMKKLTKNDKITFISICVFVTLVLAAFVTMAVLHAKNSTLTLCGYVRFESDDKSQVGVVIQQKEGEEEYSKYPIFQKAFSEKCSSKNLTPIVFSKNKGISEYGYLITLTNSSESTTNFSVRLVQHGQDKDCCLPKQIKVMLSNDGEFEQKQDCSGTLEKNATKIIEIRFFADLSTLSAAPNSEFEILVETSIND